MVWILGFSLTAHSFPEPSVGQALFSMHDTHVLAYPTPVIPISWMETLGFREVSALPKGHS